MNNFTQYMPGGYYRFQQKELLNDYMAAKPVIDLVDDYLSKNNLMQAAIDLRIEWQKEVEVVNPTNFAKRLEYMKLCLRVFEFLIKEHKYDLHFLWA
jgi:hypothetical protein